MKEAHSNKNSVLNLKQVKRTPNPREGPIFAPAAGRYNLGRIFKWVILFSRQWFLENVIWINIKLICFF